MQQRAAAPAERVTREEQQALAHRQQQQWLGHAHLHLAPRRHLRRQPAARTRAAAGRAEEEEP